MTPHIGDARPLRERWRDLSLTKQTQIVEAVLDHVVVGPGRRGYNRFDPPGSTPSGAPRRPACAPSMTATERNTSGRST